MGIRGSSNWSRAEKFHRAVLDGETQQLVEEEVEADGAEQTLGWARQHFFGGKRK